MLRDLAVTTSDRIERLLQDVRYAVRTLRRSPTFSLAVLLTLALGIGVNVAMFNVIDQLMFRPYRYMRDPERVQRVYLRASTGPRLVQRESFPYARYLDLRSFTTSFSQSAAFYPTTVAIGSGTEARERPIAAVSASFFEFFTAPPALGRYFTTAEDSLPVGAPVAVLGYAYWQSAFGGRDVIGAPLRVNNVLCTIIGVAPDGMTGVPDALPPSLYLPMTTLGGHEPGGSSVEYWRRYNWDWAEMMVRRKPGVTTEVANADLTQAFVKSREVARSVHSRMPRTDPVPPVAIAGPLKTAAGPYAGREAHTLLWVTGVALIVLLIACANVANLFLARAAHRRREVALRIALGVGRWRLARQALTEALVLSLLGGATGVALARGGAILLRRAALPDTVAVDDVGDWRVIGVALVAALIASLLTALVPVLASRRGDVAATLKAGMRVGSYQRSFARSSLLVVQGALSVVLLVGAGLFIRSLDRLRTRDIGLDAAPVLMVHWDRRGEQMDDAARMQLRLRLLDIARGIPGVERAAWVNNVPLQGTSSTSITVPGIDSVGRLGRFTYQTASVDYFAVVGTRLVRGRAFTDFDRLDGPPVIVVSASMARVLWPGAEALGRCVRVGADTMPCSTVVGIAEDAVHDPVNDEPLRFYLPFAQVPSEGGSLLVLRMQGSLAAQGEGVRRTLQRAMPGEQFLSVAPMTALLDEQQRSWRAGATLFVTFGALALFIAAVGLYAIVSYAVSQRTHELGVRMALGARARHVVQLVVGEGVRLVALGVGIGLLLSLAGARWVEPLLYRQSAIDPVVYLGVASILAAVSIVATSAPAFRATRADPNVALRAD